MTLRLLFALAMALAVAGCGVKSDLERPDHKPIQKNEKDPSRPPSPIGR